jgi:hypothetical protein
LPYLPDCNAVFFPPNIENDTGTYSYIHAKLVTKKFQYIYIINLLVQQQFTVGLERLARKFVYWSVIFFPQFNISKLGGILNSEKQLSAFWQENMNGRCIL